MNIYLDKERNLIDTEDQILDNVDSDRYQKLSPLEATDAWKGDTKMSLEALEAICDEYGLDEEEYTHGAEGNFDYNIDAHTMKLDVYFEDALRQNEEELER